MYYINSEPTGNGNYGNPQSNAREGMLALPDGLLSAYIDAMGFAALTVEDGVVTAVERNQAAYDAYQAAHPGPAPPTPAEQREEAYNTLEIVAWDGEQITVTHAAELWAYYAAEDNEKAGALTARIAAAKARIRELYPDEGGDGA